MKKKSDSDITPCLNCKPIEDMKEKDLPYSEAIEEIPDWSKKTGNYSPYPKMITCNERYNLLSDNRDSMVSKKPDITGNPVTLDLDLGKEYKESCDGFGSAGRGLWPPVSGKLTDAELNYYLVE